MNESKENSNNIESNLDESNKNEEDLLSYSSKYKTNIYNEEENKENEIRPKGCRQRSSVDSTSISQENNINLVSTNNRMNILPKDEEVSHRSIGFKDFLRNNIEYQDNQRKMSSPLCCYYNGSDIYLSKTQKNTIDIKKSLNYIRKDSFLNNSDIINENKNIFINNNSINNINNFKNNYFYQNTFNNNINYINKNNLIQNNNEIKKLSQQFNQIPYNNINNFNIYDNRIPTNNIINNNIFLQNNNYQQQIFNINYININNLPNNQFNPINNNINRRKLSYNIEEGIIGNYFNNLLNLNNNNINPNQKIINFPQTPILFSYNEEQEKSTKTNKNKKSSTKLINNNKNEKKPFDKRKGDWLCPDCLNLNFAFRVICNRCQLPKPNNIDQEDEK